MGILVFLDVKNDLGNMGSFAKSQETFLAKDANSLIVVLHMQVALCSLLSWLCRCSVHMGSLVHAWVHVFTSQGFLGVALAPGVGKHVFTTCVGQQGGVCGGLPHEHAGHQE